MKIKAKEAFNAPNILCYIRILLIPVFTYYLLTAEEPKDYYLAAFFILLSGLTDLLDGFIARRFNMITELGKTIDPIADKLSQLAILLCLMIRVKSIFVFVLVLIFLTKELFMGVSCLLLLRKSKKLDGAMWFGKVSTAVFYMSMFLIITLPLAIPSISDVWIYILIAISTVFMLLSFALYIPVFYKLSKKTDSK